MNKKLFFLLICLVMSTTSLLATEKKGVVTITVTNSSNDAYINKVVAIPWEKIVTSNSSIDTANLVVVELNSKKQLVYQYEYAGSSGIKNLLVQISVKAKSAIKLTVQAGKHAPFTAKTYGRYVPERKEDFAWENDKIAFRMYGKELESTPKENAYGIDVWVKRTDRLIINERYQKAEYHVDHGDGLDYYHVGLALGAGNCMPYTNDTIWYSKNYTRWKVLDNGPLRTSFQLYYDDWDVSGKKVKAIKTVSLDAGSQLNKVSVQYIYDANANLPVVVGIIKRPEQGVSFLNEQKGLMGYWEPQHGKDGTTGVGVIIPTPIKQIEIKKGQFLAYTETKKDEAFVYYTGAAWDKAGTITNAEQWFAYLQKQQQQLLSNNLLVTIQ